MRKATIALIGAALLTPSCALATTFAAPNSVKAAVREANVVQTVRHGCSRGSNGRKCYHVSPRPLQPSANGDTAYFQRRYTGPSQYQAHPWANPYGSD